MTIVDELKAKYSSYSPNLVDTKVKEWQFQHPGEDLEGLRALLTSQPLPGGSSRNLEIKSCFECNEKCIHCFNSEAERKIKMPELEEIYRQIDTMTIEDTVIVQGGEPTMRNDLVEVLKYIKEKGKQVSLNTNGLRLYNEKYLEEIIPYVDRLILPIHSSHYNVFDSITQVKGSAEKVMTVFKKLLQIENLMVVTQTVINQLNYKTLLDTFDTIQNIAPSITMMLTFPIPIGFAYSSDVTPKYSEIKDYIQPALRKYGHSIYSYDIPRCYLYPYQDAVTNCDDYRCGCYIEENKRIKASSCKDCIFTKECAGVWREYGALYPDLDLTPVLAY